MKTILKSIAALCVGVALVGCNKMSPAEMAAAADKVVVKCNPEVLTSINGNIDAEITVTFPAEYFGKKGTMEVTPVLVYQGGEVAGDKWFYQGEKVQDNNTVVTVKEGCTATEKVSFKFVDGMENSYLELRAVAKAGDKSAEMPVRKVADGVNVTSHLACLAPVVTYKPDNYQQVLKKSTETQILYSINSANYKNSQLRSDSVKEYQKNVTELKANERYTVTGTEIVSYASPDGGQELNAKLSDKRSASAQAAWKTIGKDLGLDEVALQSVGQDWEGFKAAVENSDIADKGLILRVLSMYDDPAVREKEIKNIAQVYNELKTKVLPELRRSRFVTNLDFRNYTDEELALLAEQQLDNFDEVSLLHLATIATDPANKETYYNMAVDKFASETAAFNLVVLSVKNGNLEAAKLYYGKLGNTADADVQNLEGAIAVLAGDETKAKLLFEKSGTVDAKANIGVLYMKKGDYKTALGYLPQGVNKAVCNLMLANNDAALEALGDCTCAPAEYVRAIVAARKGDSANAAKYIESASKCDKLKARSAVDIEFKTLAK